MAVTGFLHHIGTFLLLLATVLLIITTISAPVVNDIGLLKVTLSNATAENWSQVSFGTFGWCVLNTADDDRDYCSRPMVGYNPAAIMNDIEDTSFSDASAATARGLTKAMILHPIACGIAFVAVLLASGAGFVGSLLAALVAGAAFVVTAVALICDFVLFGLVRDHVNSADNDASGSRAEFSAAIWTVLAAGVLSLLGAVVVLFTCCSARLHKRRTADPVAKSDYGTPARRRRWF